MPKQKTDIKELVSLAEGFIYSPEISEKKLAELREKYSTVPDATTRDGYEEIRLGLAELRTLRTGTEKHRKAMTAPFYDIQKQINEKSKAVIAEVAKNEEPLKEAKAEEDARKQKEKEEKARLEALRIQAVEARIDKDIRSRKAEARGKSSEEIRKIILEIAPIDPRAYEDRVLSAEAAIKDAVNFLEDAYESTVKFEEQEAVRLEQERIRMEEEERQRKIREEAEAKLKAEREALEKEKAEIARLKAEHEALLSKSEPAPEPEENDDPDNFADHVLEPRHMHPDLNQDDPEEVVQETAPTEPSDEVESPRAQDITKLESMLKIGLPALEIYMEIIDGKFQTIGKVVE